MTAREQLAELAERYCSFVRTRMIDDDGLCRSFMNASEFRPWRNDELIDDDLTDMFQNAPDKAGCLTYENSLMSTSEFTMACITRHAVTDEACAREWAARGIDALLGVAREGRHYMPGYLPKPFGGMARPGHSHEISPDQYTKAVRALHAWRPTADAGQLEEINPESCPTRTPPPDGRSFAYEGQPGSGGVAP